MLAIYIVFVIVLLASRAHGRGDSLIKLVNATEHDNWLYFDGPSGYEVTVSYTDDEGHSITAGQPYSGVTVSGSGIDVKAGRSGSSDPANWFEEDVFALLVERKPLKKTIIPKEVAGYVLES